jgi:hypothetical protein
MTDQADMEARAQAVFEAVAGVTGIALRDTCIAAMLAFEAERGAEREAAAYDRAAEVARGEAARPGVSTGGAFSASSIEVAILSLKER